MVARTVIDALSRDRVVSASREDGDDESVSERFLGAQTLGIGDFFEKRGQRTDALFLRFY